MAEDVRRTQDASQQKIQKAAKKRGLPEAAGEESRFRNTPAGRRLAALRKRKSETED